MLAAEGCSRDVPVVELTRTEVDFVQDVIVVPADHQWTNTGVQVRRGETIMIMARGSIRCRSSKNSPAEQPREVGPIGTFLYADNLAHQPFPLPAAAGGPAPPFSLIGRIGDGSPFYVGKNRSWQAEQSGPLSLGINDFDCSGNSGRFVVQVSKPDVLPPVAFEQEIPWHGPEGHPREGCSVVVFYLDGLRPDVVREMAAMGHIPTVKKLFIEGGVGAANAFTAFPSDTITSNGTMWTGCFSDRHGLKGQVRFSRRTLHSKSHLEPLGPSRSARLLAPQGIDFMLHKARSASLKAIKGEEAGTRWQQATVTGVPPIFQHLRAGGGDWATGVLPMMTEIPPLLWTRSMVRHMPYLHSQDGWKYIDDANTHYAVRHLLIRKSPVTIIWLPETDTVSHKFSRGQFGITRRTIARADVLISRVVDELEAQGRLHNTYLMLLSDHGHHGGRNSHLTHFDIADEFFFRPRELSPSGEWVGGGLGLSVRQHRFWNRHPQDHSREFVFLDADSAGVARIFLPRGRFRSRSWMGANRPADLISYKIADHLPAVNLVDSLTATRVARGDGTVQHPVDLVLMKLSDRSILISTTDRGQAVIDRKKNRDGKWSYKYTVVKDIQPITNGDIDYKPIEFPQTDPLGLVGHVPRRMLTYYHDERDWLLMTTETRYPDSVVTLTRHMLWQENLKYREAEFAPDLVVTARPGWYFGIKSSPGTMHGYPLDDSMTATLFITGPNVRRGARMTQPCRLVDLTPTILEMTGTHYDPDEMDGTALHSIYRSEGSDDSVVTRPVYWQDVDLGAWRSVEYAPLKPYEHLPITVNRPSSPFDLNNIVYNALSLTELNVIRLFDDVLSPLSGGNRPLIRTAEKFDQQVRNGSPEWMGEATEVVDLPGTSLADYSLFSLGNLKRADRAIDWLQHRRQRFYQSAAQRLRRSPFPAEATIDDPIDTAQSGIWEVYRFAQRVAMQVVDETIINSIENETDRTINRFRMQPAEIVVEKPISTGKVVR